MFNDSIADYVAWVAAKYLTAVDAEPASSHQHEIGGLVRAGFKPHLGEPPIGEKNFFKARMVYMRDTDETPLSCEDTVTWYNTRHEGRRPEYRLYYRDNIVTEQFSGGDFSLVAKLKDESILMVFCPPDSSVEAQLRSIFGLHLVSEDFNAGSVGTGSLLLPVRLLLEDLGFLTTEPEAIDATWLDRLIERFGGASFPVTRDFSGFARETVGSELDPILDPDATLMAWMEHEEFLFRVYERHLVQDRLRAGFGVQGDDVDEFISYSLSVQNRRKSRVGHAFEGHLESVFKVNGLQYERPRGKGRVTENNAKPDFIFPSFAKYHDPDYPNSSLVMLGAKTTCKDRWRQVLSEADRIEKKHLVTLEPGISIAQTDEMVASNLQLVVPSVLHSTYSSTQRSWLQTIGAFVNEVQCKSGTTA